MLNAEGMNVEMGCPTGVAKSAREPILEEALLLTAAAFSFYILPFGILHSAFDISISVRP
jgi:hypothetical protein